MLVSACTITQHVEPVPPDTLSSLCIQENDQTWSKEFLPTLRDQLQRRGIASTVYHGTPPPSCRFRLTYDVNWGWDLAVYLTYANLRIYDGTKPIGEATYDARDGDARFDKFGHTEDKIAPLLDQLLRGNPGTAASSS
jgi:hypothetical protein